MKTSLLAVLLLLTTSCIVLAQSIFEDAKVLSRYIVNGKVDPEKVLSEKETSLQELQKELTDKASNEQDAKKLKALGKTVDSIKTILSSALQAKNDTIFSIVKRNGLTKENILANPFLKKIDFGGFVQAFNPSKLIRSGLSAAGGLDVTNIANAVADIMIEHAKQELTVAFFDRFKKFADTNPEFGILFPKTTQNLANLLSYKYPEMLPTLRSGFLEDIRQITFRLDDVLDLPRYQELFRNLPEVTIAIRSLRLVHELETGASNPAEVILEFSSFKEWSEGTTAGIKHVGSIVKISAFFSESIRSSKTDEVWASGKELKKVFHNDTVGTVYLGLLYQKAEKEKIAYIRSDGTQKLLTEMLTEHQSDILVFRNKLKELMDLTGRVNDAYKDIRNKTNSGQSISDEDYYSYINTSLDVVEYGFSLAELFGEDVQKAEPYLLILRQSNDLFRNIYTKEYNQAITNTLDILSKINELVKQSNHPTITIVNAEALVSGKETSIKLNDALKLEKTNNTYLLKKSTGETLRSFESLDRTILENNAAFFLATKETDKNPLDKLLSFLQEIKPYALFIANMIEAKTEEDIKNAIENAILPVGSSAIKKFSISNISVQSYLGPRLNLHHWSNGKTTWNNRLGVAAPIGVAFSWGGRGEQFKDPGSFTLFLALLDIGAIVDYKLTKDDDEETQDYKVKLGQIFAPGAYAVYGFPCKIPLSLGLGAQYGPGLLKGNNGVEAVDPDWSIRLFLAVDIPFFTLHNKPRNDLPKK